MEMRKEAGNIERRKEGLSVSLSVCQLVRWFVKNVKNMKTNVKTNVKKNVKTNVKTNVKKSEKHVKKMIKISKM